MKEDEKVRQLKEWRALREEQDRAYKESLLIDQQKEKEKADLRRKEEEEARLNEQRNERVEKMKNRFLLKVQELVPGENGIPVAFKFGDGRKLNNTFHVQSTKMDMYQFVFTKLSTVAPFSLHTVFPFAHEIRLSSFTASDLLNEHLLLRGSTVMVQELPGVAIDNFLDLLEQEPEPEPVVEEEEEERIVSEEEKERLAYMQSINAVTGEHTIDRRNVYEDVLDLYREGEVVGECPIMIEFSDELGIDHGGVQRDMFSAFWEKCYSVLFDGATTLIPMIHPQTDMSLFPIIGRILSHAYLVCGDLPIRIALPSLICMLLGPSTNISRKTLIDSFLDYISSSERETFRKALSHRGANFFPSNMQADLMDTLSVFGCRTLPTPSNFVNLVEQIARYEFISKPAAGIAMIFSGIPLTHQNFWKRKSANDIEKIYQSLAISSKKIISLLSFPDVPTMQQSRVSHYLTSMIGNMGTEDLRSFMRFITGSCTCISSEIKVFFNKLSGFERRPIAHTCDCSVELPTEYRNYEDFYREFQCVLDKNNEEYVWPMYAL